MNGTHFCQFNHRLPLSTARFIYVNGDVSVQSMVQENDGSGGQPPAHGKLRETYRQKTFTISRTNLKCLLSVVPIIGGRKASEKFSRSQIKLVYEKYLYIYHKYFSAAISHGFFVDYNKKTYTLKNLLLNE